MVAQMLGHHKETVNAMFDLPDWPLGNQGGEGVYLTRVDLLQLEELENATADWYDYMEDEDWRMPQEADRTDWASRQQESKL